MESLICPTCLMPHFKIKFDRKLKPYGVCTLCSFRIFVKNKRCMIAMLSWCKTLEKLDRANLDGLYRTGEQFFMTVRQQSQALQAWDKQEVNTLVEANNYGKQ